MTSKRSLGTMLSLIATVIVLLAFGGITVFADENDNPDNDNPGTVQIVASGYCGAEGNGENISWELDSTGLLTFSGTGKMKDYEFEASPWYNNDQIIKVIFNDGITNIGNYSINACSSVISITIPNSVTSIGEAAFYKCTKLGSIAIPNGVTSIGDAAFEYCSSLASITIPKSVTNIGGQAFYDCYSLLSITIPDGVTSIGDSTFNGCTKLASITIPYGVTGIGNSAFSTCTKLTSITIPNSVTSIGDNAFISCRSLTSITIPDSVTSIGDHAFEECSSLASVTIPNSVTSIGDHAFSFCRSLSSVTIPNSVTSIGDEVFFKCTKLDSITIPNGVTSIGDKAFEECSSLVSVTIPNSVTSIGDHAFEECSSLASVTIPNSVTSIGGNAFKECTKLTSITIPNSVTSIGGNAFKECTKLASITIPNSVTSIGDHAFSNCNNISKLSLNADPIIFKNNLNEIFESQISATVYVPLVYISAYDSLFSDFKNVEICGIYNDSRVQLAGYSLSLDGSIGVNFHIIFEKGLLNNNNTNTAYIKFIVNNNEQRVYLKNAEVKDGHYIFRCDTAAKEMADTITAQFYLSNDEAIGDPFTYSVRTYAAHILKHRDEYSSETIVLVEAMLNYGAASQKYFNHNTDDLANSIIDDEEQHTSFNVKPTYINSGDIRPAKVSLVLNSTLTLKLYLNNKDVTDITSFEYGKQTLNSTKSGDYTIISIEGLKATQFSSALIIKCYTDETNYKTIKYAPSNYADIVLKQPNGGVITDELKDVVNMLCQFSMAARVYSNSQVGT